MELPLQEAFWNVGHRVDDELDKAPVHDAAPLPGVVVGQEIPHLPLAVGTGGANVLVRLGLDAIRKGLQNLLELDPSRDPGPPVGKVEGLADGKP